MVTYFLCVILFSLSVTGNFINSLAIIFFPEFHYSDILVQKDNILFNIWKET